MTTEDDSVQCVQNGPELEQQHPSSPRPQHLGRNETSGDQGEEEVEEGDHVGRDEVENGGEVGESVKVLSQRSEDELARVIVHQSLHG